MSPYVSNLLAATKSKWNAWANISLWAAQRLRGSSRARVASPLFTQLGGCPQQYATRAQMNPILIYSKLGVGFFFPLEAKINLGGKEFLRVLRIRYPVM